VTQEVDASLVIPNNRLTLAEGAIQPWTRITGNQSWYQKIIKAVTDFYNLKERDLFTDSRKKEIVKPRQIAMFLMRKELKSSFPSISRLFGGKDHTTAIYACKKVKLDLEKMESLNEEIEAIKQMIYSC
jgi:chromosomal replication initiator protein